MDFNILSIFQNYGYYILVGLFASTYVYHNFIRPTIDKYLERRADAEYHKDPDKFQAKAQAMEEARTRMQEKLAKDAEEHQRKMEEREKQKRQEVLDRVSHVSTGEKLGGGDSKKSFRAEYNPLMGPGGSGGYRPPKKGCCGKKCG